MSAKKIALFIDADNISAKFGKQIIDALESRGEIFIRRIYGNWEKISLHGWNECILNFSLRAVQQPDFATGKNATDMSLTIDAMDVLYGGKAEIFALVSNDSDFTPLVIRLREGGMNVIGMGNENASISFRNACNEFIDLDKLLMAASVSVKVSATSAAKPVKKISPPPAKSPTPKVVPISEQKLQSERDKKIQQFHNILRETAKAHNDLNGFTNLSHVGNIIAQRNLSFKDLGHSSLTDFVAAFPNLYELRRTKNITYYRCRQNEMKPVDAVKLIHSILRETAEAYKDLNDANGFTELAHAGQKAREKNVSIKDLGYSSWIKFVSEFPKLYGIKKVGNNFYYRCK